MFYTYHQNNSRGYDHITDDLGKVVIIEGMSEAQAELKALSLGIYFNGVANGSDCDCCGDRWSNHFIEATEQPQVYDTPVDEINSSEWFTPVVVHYADGTKRWYGKDSE